MGVLILASKSDSASMTLYDAMLRLDGWGETLSSSVGDYFIHKCGRVYLLVIDQFYFI